MKNYYSLFLLKLISEYKDSLELPIINLNENSIYKDLSIIYYKKNNKDIKIL